jgi:hypothetical protein
MKIVEDSNAWGEVRVSTEGRGKRIPLVQNAEIMGDMNVTTR